MGRRRRRAGTVRWAALGLASVSVAVTASAVWMAHDLGDRPDPPDRRQHPVTTSTTSTTIRRTTTTTIPLDPIRVGELPGPYTRVVATGNQILAVAPGTGLAPRRIVRASARSALGVGEGRLVYQASSDEESLGDIVVLDERASHILRGEDDGGWHLLLDAAVVQHRPEALVLDTRAGTPEDWSVHLLRLDLETMERTDLGQVAGWEETITEARLLPDGRAVLHRVGTGAEAVELRRRDGSAAWSVTLPEDVDRTLTVRRFGTAPTDVAPLVIERAMEEGARDLVVRQLELETGAEHGRSHLRVHTPDGTEPGARLCGYAEAEPSSLLCTQSGSPALRIDLRDGSSAVEPGAPYGTMTTWRFDG